MSCFDGCFSFISEKTGLDLSSLTSGANAGPDSSDTSQSKLVSVLPPPFSNPPKRDKAEGRVSGKIRLRPGQRADPANDMKIKLGEKVGEGNNALTNVTSDPAGWFQEDVFLKLLEKLIGEAKYLQNSKTSGLVPQEERAAMEVVEVLKPYAKNRGGPLQIEVLQYVPQRPNVKITLPAYKETKRTVGLIGSHLDVVPASPEEWKWDPFKLTRDGDKLYGRGSTDCLGHVALITSMLVFLSKQRLAGGLELDYNLVVVFIAAEEGGEFGVGIDVMCNEGKIDELKPEYETREVTVPILVPDEDSTFYKNHPNPESLKGTSDMPMKPCPSGATKKETKKVCVKGGPVFWIDSADSQPCCGTNGVAQWELKASGRLFHSGLPHKGINSIEFASEALAEIQDQFYKDFPENPEQKAYGFAVGSSMKPTQISCNPGSLNQIPPWCKISGDIRLVPFYSIMECMERIEGYVDNINKNLEKIRTRGPYSKYKIDLGENKPANDLDTAKLELSWGQSADAATLYEGIACNLTSNGHKALVQATSEVSGVENTKPYSVSGSLPLVRMLQKDGFDLQIDGFGLMSTYHAVDEYCLLSDMKKAHEILLRVMSLLNVE